MRPFGYLAIELFGYRAIELSGYSAIDHNSMRVSLIIPIVGYTACPFSDCMFSKCVVLLRPLEGMSKSLAGLSVARPRMVPLIKDLGIVPRRQHEKTHAENHSSTSMGYAWIIHDYLWMILGYSLDCPKGYP